MRRLWLDDVRLPPEDGWWWAKNLDAFRLYISHYGMPHEMSLDHDLGDDERGIDALKWLADMEVDTRRTTITVHSANPIGRDNMLSFLRSWERHLDSERGKL